MNIEIFNQIFIPFPPADASYSCLCTQLHLETDLRPWPCSLHCCPPGHGAKLSGAEHTSYEASCGKPVVWDWERPRGKKWGARHEGSWPFQAITLILWYELGFLWETLPPSHSCSSARMPMPGTGAKQASRADELWVSEKYQCLDSGNWEILQVSLLLFLNTGCETINLPLN